MTKILVFIPMYNCENQIGRVIDQFTDEVKNYINEVIIINSIRKVKETNYRFTYKIIKK